MQHSVALHKIKIVEQGALAVYCLSSHSGTSINKICILNLRNQALQAADERGFTQRAVNFFEAAFPVTPRHLPEAWVKNVIQNISRTELGPAITFPFQSEHRIGAGFDISVRMTREMHSQKRKAGICDGIDQVFYQVTSGRNHLVVLSPKRHNFQPWITTGHCRYTIAVQSSAINEKPGNNVSGSGNQGKILGGGLDR